MKTQHLNIRREPAKAAAREIAASFGQPISRTVEEVLLAAQARLQRHIEAGGTPASFRGELIAEAGQPQQRRDDGAEEVS